MNMQERELLRKAVHDEKRNIRYSSDGEYGGPYRFIDNVDLSDPDPTKHMASGRGRYNTVNLHNVGLWSFVEITPLSD